MLKILKILPILLVSCAPFTATAPNNFATYKENDSDKFQAVSPDGVLYRVVAYEQKSEASIDFWRDAFLLKMKNSNYKPEDTLNISIGGKPAIGYIFSFANNVGSDLYLVAAVPSKNKIIVVEAAAESKKFNARKNDILEAISKIKIAGQGQSSPNLAAAVSMEAPPCDNCRIGEEVSLDVKINRSYHEQKGEILSLDSGELIGVLPALNVMVKHPEKCDYCHSFSESAVEFNFAAKEDSILRTRFPNNERTLLYPGSQVPEKDSADFQKAFETLRDIPLNENMELKNFFKKLSLNYKVRYIAFASFIEVNLKDKKTFDWESEWSLWDAKNGELLFWDYQNLTAKSKNSSPVDREWAACWLPD